MNESVAFWLSEPVRLASITGALALLLCAEAIVPMLPAPRGRWRRATPNLALAALVVLLGTLLSSVTVLVVDTAARWHFGLFYLLATPAWAAAVLGFAALDLAAYLAHVSMHMTDFGWRLHRVHHSDQHVDVTTALRQHPGETAIRLGFQLATVVLLAVPPWIGILYLTLAGLNAHLEHANLRLPASLDAVLRLVFVTPDMHKVHHSRVRTETNSNYATIFSCWDRLFGTYRMVERTEGIQYGLEGCDRPDQHTLGAMLAAPFTTTTAELHTRRAPAVGAVRSAGEAHRAR